MKHAPVLLTVLAVSIASAQPRIVNANLQNRAVSGSLDATVQSIAGSQADPAWVGYAMPIIAGEHRSCCYYSDGNYSYNGCLLEPRDSSNRYPVQVVQGAVKLES